MVKNIAEIFKTKITVHYYIKNHPVTERENTLCFHYKNSKLRILYGEKITVYYGNHIKRRNTY
jgi:hypothetical protein